MVRVEFGERFVLHPHQAVLGSTLEFIRLPRTLTGYVIGRSSWGRLDLVIATAIDVTWDFSGCLTLELVNVGEIPIGLYPGVRIAQLALHTSMAEPDAEATRRSRYRFSLEPEFSKIHLDREWGFITARGARRVIGISGTLSAGKTLIAKHLESRGYRLYSLSSYVKQHMAKAGAEPTHSNLQAMGNSLRRRHGSAVLARWALDDLAGPNVCVDGIRNPEEAHFFREMTKFALLFVDADPSQRWDWARNKVGKMRIVNREEFDRLDQVERGILDRQEYGLRVDDCRLVADQPIIQNDGDIDKLYKQVDDFIETNLERPGLTQLSLED